MVPRSAGRWSPSRRNHVATLHVMDLGPCYPVLSFVSGGLHPGRFRQKLFSHRRAFFGVTSFVMIMLSRYTFWFRLFPQHSCWGSPFLPSMNVSWLIVGIELFRTPVPPWLRYRCCCRFRWCVIRTLTNGWLGNAFFWKAIFTTLKHWPSRFTTCINEALARETAFWSTVQK